MPENSGKVSGKEKIDKPMSRKFTQLSQTQLENLILSMISKAVMEWKLLSYRQKCVRLKSYTNNLMQMQKKQEFISGKHNDFNEDYIKVLTANKQYKHDLKHLRKRTDDIQQKTSEEELKLNEI